MEPISIYIHIPMCVKKCVYCDFTSFCGRMKQREAYTEAVCREMREQAAFFGARRVETVFFGGGTPTLMTGAQIGTAFHRMMRMLDLDALRATRDLAAEIDRQRAALLEKGVVSKNELAAVHPRLLVRLFASPLGVRMLAAGEMHREWAFTYRRETEDGAQLLQGVIDCCFIERGAWVLVDYKTDADAAGAIERHRPQLELYAQVLAGITGRPVRERVLYLVRAGMGYQV